jgi:CubicO group peptidase (beta-lactamase class C family)
MKEIRRLIEVMLPQQEHLDALAVGVIDFESGNFEITGDVRFSYDLASVTKVLGNAAVYALKPEAFTADMRLLLEHRAGLPAWGLLPNPGWRDIILSYQPKSSETLYSDFSAMRVTLELEKLGLAVPKVMESIWDPEVSFWAKYPRKHFSPKTGERGGYGIYGDVHDPNAWVIKEWCGHAGLFGTVSGVCRTLLNLESLTSFISKTKTALKGHEHRFINGWDRVENPANTLAGVGCSQHTFGHLGFTGTSVWIDADKRKGHVILSNTTRDGWYCKDGLNEMRRAIGECVWKG